MMATRTHERLLLTYLLVVAGLLPLTPAVAQSTSAELPLTQAGVVQLKAQPAIKKGLASLPRVVPGTGIRPAVAAVVNRHLAALDAEALKSRRDCLDMAHDEQATADFTRTAEVNMRGPRFLSVTATSEYFCGGAHPDNDSTSVVYDLQTGHPVNWLAYLPKGARADGGSVVWEPLHRMLVESADKDCKEVMTDNTSGYTLYLTAKGKLMVQPGQSSHATQNCDDPLELDVAAARKLGVAPALLEVMVAVKTTQQ